MQHENIKIYGHGLFETRSLTSFCCDLAEQWWAEAETCVCDTGTGISEDESPGRDEKKQRSHWRTEKGL